MNTPSLKEKFSLLSMTQLRQHPEKLFWLVMVIALLLYTIWLGYFLYTNFVTTVITQNPIDSTVLIQHQEKVNTKLLQSIHEHNLTKVEPVFTGSITDPFNP